MVAKTLVVAALFPLLALGVPTARIVSAAGDATPDPSEKRVRFGTHVTLFAVLVPDRGAPVAAAPRVNLGRQAQKAAPPPARAGVRWFRVEAASRSLSNTDPTFHWEPIEYRDVELVACTGQWTCPADVSSTSLGDRGGLGTMAFRVEITIDGKTVASPGAEQRYRGGLVPEITRVTVRRDDTYLGYLTELFGTPYIWGSAGSDDVHQAERRIGSDCADFVTYGVRRLGAKVPYTSTWQIAKFTRAIATSTTMSPDGTYLDATGAPITIGPKGALPGDLLLFSGHVGALVRDEPPIGIFDTHDVMAHTCWAPPIEQSLDDSGYGGRAVKVLRWKALDHAAER